MPFHLFLLNKKDKDWKSKSQTNLNLYNENSKETADFSSPALIGDGPDQGDKIVKTKGGFNLFHKHSTSRARKVESQVSFKEVKKEKQLREFLKAKSKSSVNLFEKRESKMLKSPLAEGTETEIPSSRTLQIKEGGKKEKQLRELLKIKSKSSMNLFEKNESKSVPDMQKEGKGETISTGGQKKSQLRSKSSMNLFERNESKSVPDVQKEKKKSTSNAGQKKSQFRSKSSMNLFDKNSSKSASVIEKEKIAEAPAGSQNPQRPNNIQHSNSNSSSGSSGEQRHYIQHSGAGEHRHHIYHNNHVDHRLEAKKSASCGSCMDNLGRDRRLSDIAQLDNYIEYLLRTNTDDASLANRLCCAQLLRKGLVQIELNYRKSPRHSSSSSSHDSLHQSTPNNANQSPPASHSQRFHRNTGSFRRRPPSLNMVNEPALRNNFNNEVEVSNEASGNRSSHSGSQSTPDSDDNDSQNVWKSGRCMAKETTIHAFPSDIEIF